MKKRFCLFALALALSLPAIKQWMNLRKMKRRERI